MKVSLPRGTVGYLSIIARKDGTITAKQDFSSIDKRV